MLRVFTHDACLRHASPGHPERPERLAAALGALRASGLPLDVAEAPEVDLDLVRAVHAPGMIGPPAGWIDADTYVTPDSWAAALRSAGAAVEAARSALRGEPAFALGRPPGHHATRATAMGFCLLNNVALAAHDLTRQGKRVAIVDVDVHHGNGTQDVFWRRRDVLYASLHGWPLYPGTGRATETGEGFTLNVPCASGTGHEGWIEALGRAVVPKVRAFRPDVVLVSAGYDADLRDPLGNLALAPRSFHEAIRLLREVQPRVACVLEGGYDLAAVGEGVVETARAMMGEPSRFPEPPAGGPRPWEHLREALVAGHAELG